MKSLFLLFSHTLTPEQENDAQLQLGVRHFVCLPEALQERWSNVPPDADHVTELLRPFKKWLKENAQAGDIVLVQGDFGMTFEVVGFCLKKGLVPVYATTERVSAEEKQPDGSIAVKKVFRHKRFRRYGA